MPLSTIAANQIKNGTIVDANINSSANIATTKLGTGAILQTVVSSSEANQVMTSSYADIPSGGHQITITPNFTSSQILLIFTGSRISYTTTNGISSLKIGSIGGGSFSDVKVIEDGHYVTDYGYSRSSTIVDSPSTTSAVIYKMQGKSTGTGNAHYTYSGVPAVH